MIWIASFPRSGNTFLRNILFEVYGLSSSTYHHESDYPLDEDFADYPFVKTHLRPRDLDSAGFDTAIPSVYLARDGRDAICSIAHHRSDLIAPGSDLYQNMFEAIVAQRGSFFGGWSTNAEEWIERASLVIRYEDLLADPLGQAQRIGQLLELPPARPERLPSFTALKFGIPEYGAGKHLERTDEDRRETAQKFFRRGEAGAWRDELPEELQELFWSYHGEAMARLGYTRAGGLAAPHPDLDLDLRLKLGQTVAPPARKFRVLMEADKLVSADNDGVRRYQVELLKAMYPAVSHPLSRWHLDLYCHGRIVPVERLAPLLFGRPSGDADAPPAESASLAGRLLRLERHVMALVPRGFVDFLHRRRITLLHDTYEFLRGAAVAVTDFAADVAFRVKKAFAKLALPQSLRPSDADAAGYDLIHLPLQQNFRPFRLSLNRKVITIHDLTHIHFPDMHTAVNIRNAQRGLDFARTSEAELIAVSNATRDDILAHTDIPAERVHVIYEAADPKLFNRKYHDDDCNAVKRRYGIDPNVPYILSLSTLEPRKNLINTIRAFLALLESSPELEVNLVIAGNRGWDYHDIFRLAGARKDRIRFTGFIKDADLPYLYSDAVCLSYLSLYEGFGLPLLESMRCGTPVVFGDNSSITEVVGDGGLPADPHDIDMIRQQYLRLLREPELREQLGRAALRRANQFSWRSAASETLSLYERLIDA